MECDGDHQQEVMAAVLWVPVCDGSVMALLSPLSLQAYFRQGVALQYLGRHADALAAFASGLAQDPKSLQLLVGMVEAAMKSPMRGKHKGFSGCHLLLREPEVGASVPASEERRT